METCSFELENMCGMVQSTEDNDDWQRITQVSSGPQSDHTYAGICQGIILKLFLSVRNTFCMGSSLISLNWAAYKLPLHSNPGLLNNWGIKMLSVATCMSIEICNLCLSVQRISPSGQGMVRKMWLYYIRGIVSHSEPGSVLVEVRIQCVWWSWSTN